MHMSHLHIRLELILVFCSMKRLGIFLLPLHGMLVYCRVTPLPRVACWYPFGYTWVERGTVRVKSQIIPKNITHCPGQGSNPGRTIWSHTYLHVPWGHHDANF